MNQKPNLRKALIGLVVALGAATGVAGVTPVAAHGGGMMGGGMMYGDADDDGNAHAMGRGMMGGWMGGPMMDGGGMAGFGLRDLYRLDLSAAQRQHLRQIDDDLRRKNWDLMGRMHDEMSGLRSAPWKDGKPDRAAVLAANKRMFDLRQKMLENGLDAYDQALAELTPDQRAQLARQWSR